MQGSTTADRTAIRLMKSLSKKQVSRKARQIMQFIRQNKSRAGFLAFLTSLELCMRNRQHLFMSLPFSSAFNIHRARLLLPPPQQFLNSRQIRKVLEGRVAPGSCAQVPGEARVGASMSPPPPGHALTCH